MSIQDGYYRAAYTPSDINEHLPVLLSYTKQCSSVVECGVRNIVSSWAFAYGLMGTPNNQYVLVDPYKSSAIDQFLSECTAVGVNASFVEKSDLDCPLVSTDLLFIDTWHVYGHLKRELARWHGSVGKFIILHDTTVDEVWGETLRMGMNQYQQSAESGIPVEEITRGLWPAVTEFLNDHPEWKIDLRLTNNNGLTILRRIV
jgi:cephalosporin hydroxylase